MQKKKKKLSTPQARVDSLVYGWGWGLGGKQWNRFGEYFSFPPNIGHLKLKYILPVELFVILLKKSFL